MHIVTAEGSMMESIPLEDCDMIWTPDRCPDCGGVDLEAPKWAEREYGICKCEEGISLSQEWAHQHRHRYFPEPGCHLCLDN